MKKLAHLIVSFIFLGFLGCSHVADYLSIAKDKGLSKEYLDVLNTWTRKETVYSQFETQVTISATYQGQAFKKAYLNEYDRIYNLSPAEKEKQDALQRESASAYREFFFYAYLPEKNDNDFSKQNSIWTVFLIEENGKRIDPVEVRKIDKVTTLIEVFYPYAHQYYGSCYRLRFPPAEGSDGQTEGRPGKPFQLIFTSVLGKATLVWK